jgi:urease accessory protein
MMGSVVGAMAAEETPAVTAGWQARLDLTFERRGTRTVLTRRRHEGPLSVQKPFYPEVEVDAGHHRGAPCHVFLIHPPGGVASGDRLELDVSLQPRSHALLTTPAAGKFYRRGPAGEAWMSQALNIDGGVLEWLPQENIFYPNSAVQLRTVVRLKAASCFMGWEIGCLGLPACGRSLEAGRLRLGFELWNDGRPVLLERLKVDGAGLGARWGMAGHAAFGTAIFFPATQAVLDGANAALSRTSDLTIACTLVDEVLICRAIGPRADHLRGAFVELWRTLRPLLLGREAVSPRIWST